MNTITRVKPVPHMRFRKQIDLDIETKKALTMQAIEHGMNLKVYIERVLKELAETDDDKAIVQLLKNDDIDTESYILQGKEKEHFLNELAKYAD